MRRLNSHYTTWQDIFFAVGMIDRKTFLELADIHIPHCVSIYMYFEEPEKNRVTLKNSISNAEKKLKEAYGLDPKTLDKKLRPLSSRLEDPEWLESRHKSVAAFIYDKELNVYEFDNLKFEDKVVVSDHLFLLPLASILHLDKEFYFLTLSSEKVKLYHISMNTITESPISSRLPDNINDVVGYDVEQKSLQFRSGQEGTGEGMFHGQGSGAEEEKKQEYEVFFREVDKKLNSNVDNTSIPLIIGCVEFLYPIYKSVNSYPNLWKKYAQGNFDKAENKELKEVSEKILSDMIRMDYQKATDEFEKFLSKGKASYGIGDIIPSAIEGRIDSLIIQKDKDIFGRYNPSENKVEVDQVEKTDNTSLLNKAAIKTIAHDGNVYIVDEDDLPVKESEVNAVYRYSHRE